MKRRELGKGPTAAAAATEDVGARLLPVERLLEAEGGREAVEGEQRPHTAVQRPARRALALPEDRDPPPGYGLPHD